MSTTLHFLSLLAIFFIPEGVPQLSYLTKPNRFPFLALFIERETFNVVSSGTIIGRRFVATIRYPLMNYSVADVLMTVGHQIEHRNLSGLRTFELEEYLKIEKRVLIVKLAEDLHIDVNVGIAPIDHIIFRSRPSYHCTFVRWTADMGKEPKVGAPLEYDMFRQEVFNFTYKPVDPHNECGETSRDYLCITQSYDVVIYPVNIGAPLLCGIAVVGIYDGFKGDHEAVTRKMFTFMNLKTLRGLAELIQGRVEETTEIRCMPAGTQGLGKVYVLQIFAAVVGGYLRQNLITV